MRLSIGIPAFNQGPFLRETLQSVLRQDHAFDEIVVSDNHSTDETPDVIATMMEECPGRIRLVRPPAHLAMAAHWNFVVQQLSGDWVTLLSIDDVALPNFASSVEKATTGRSSVVLVRGAWREIDLHGRLRGERFLRTVKPLTRPPRTLYEQRFGPKGSFAATAFRRDVWERVGGFPEDLTLVSDWGMWLLAGALGEFAYTGELMSCYRAGHQSGVLRARHGIHMREMGRIYAEVLPRATELAGLGVPRWIRRASRQRFQEALRNTSQEYGPEARPELTEAFRNWAEANRKEAMLERFARGDVLRHRSPWRALRRMAVKWLRRSG